MKQCANDTCTALTTTTFCSRRCQLTTRNLGHRGQLPDIWVSMDTERKLMERAELRGLTLKELLLDIIEEAFDWQQLEMV